ncbi:MFS transporter [Legionella micdadei]|uniref:Major facilitator superfamily MFS_1 n=1 Tax=Legionella micdadei TaxID=451 RepID=A0A098GDD7_LEGMI|nr:MFS transporter [Legionella micdadei]ARG98345.1 MFS transporter [Legionella micdadei]ARH01098.1 MFS transporter [Legionella micdadei]KTD27277.1 major facilitator superfamily transporter [Legionella micdadei]NSL18661.1 MFS transporter [Legionella micdadei]CEG59982.1 Major facilitator superfamily MFS_1 [Legionella micdadei]
MKLPNKEDLPYKKAFNFVILLGVVSLFADITYEGARSIIGPYLALLGANAAIVGFVTGGGELLGYVLRSASGYLADRTRKYWTITIFGYACNLFAVPLMALAGHWWIAAALIIIERVGKAIRTPARDAMLSHTGNKMGIGWAFGLHEALDQIGAMIGPVIIAVALYFKEGYQCSFAILLIPALLALATLLFARWLYPQPQDLEIEQGNLQTLTMNPAFWIYLAGAALIAAGYADFPLIAYHFQKTALLSPTWIPIFYSIAMGASTLSAPLLGYLYDRKGFVVLITVSLISCLFAPFAFLGNFNFALVGVILWSIGVSAQESLMRAVVAQMIPKEKRASAYGIFNTGFGIFWFLGSVLMGVLYDTSILALVIFSVTVQLLAVPLLLIVMSKYF